MVVSQTKSPGSDLSPETKTGLPYSPLCEFNSIRSRVLNQVVERTARDFDRAPLDLVLGEALYTEKIRIKRSHDNIFTKKRTQADRRLWGSIQSGLLKPSAELDRKELLQQVLAHYTEEIGGHFDPRVYKFATGVIPYGFNWLLNAASVKHFMPWKQTESITKQLMIGGETEHLRKLAQKGTILLVPTHQSNIDSILIGYIIYLLGLPPFAYGAGLNLYMNPLLTFFMGNLGAYTVDRRKSNAIYKQTLKNYSTAILREGVHSIFFPGGGRSRSGAIESKLKLGLMGTALEAQTQNLIEGREKPNVYIVPMVMSYHYVLEAGSLIEDYLAEAGKHRFIITDDESFQPFKVANFFWRLFSGHSKISVRIGKPLDVFGNLVDEEGRSIGPNGTTIDPKAWLTTRGALKADEQRDREYTLRLGGKLVDRFHRENTVLASHAVAFAYFETLRKQYPGLDLYRFLRLSSAQRSNPKERFYHECMELETRLRRRERQGELHLSEEFTNFETWVNEGVRQLGQMHEAAVIKIAEDTVSTDDMTLLYYYRNRLAGYGLSVRADELRGIRMGQHDEQGFLA